MPSPLLPLPELEIRASSLAAQGRPGATGGRRRLLAVLGLPPAKRRGGGGGTLTARGRENPPAGRTNLASPRLPPGAKTWGSAGGGGACSHRRSWEPTFPGYLPDPVSPNTQFIFLSGAASFLFSAAFRSQGSSNSRQGLSRGRNSFETWLCTLVPRTGRMHDPVSGGQLREKHSLTPAGEDKLP